MHISSLSLLALLSPLTLAAIPAKSGYTAVWSDDFNGNANAAPNSANWQRQTKFPNANWNEVQHYGTSSANSRLTGSGSLQIIPTYSGGQWNSARLHGIRDFTCPLGKKMHIQAEIRVGNNAESKQKGIWPAFWALGSSSRAKTPVAWPACGEWDIMEGRNGVPTNFGTLHCDKAPGGRCNEYVGLGAQVSYAKGAWHTWGFEVDRTQTVYEKWREQKMSWYLDGKLYKTVTGGDVGDLNVWTKIARSPFFIIMNVAVGGDFPGQPNSATVGGIESGMEIRYAAVYNSN